MPPRNPAKVQPTEVTLDHAGTRTRSFFVTLPDGMIADDLKDPAIWSVVQGHRACALVIHDHLYLVAHDNSFAVEARVVASSSNEATIHLAKLRSIPSLSKPLYEDESHKVVFGAKGYMVVRKSDGAEVGGPYANEKKAMLHILGRHAPVA